MEEPICQSVRNQKEIREIDCPECEEEGSIEIFLKEGKTVGESVCDICGYIIQEGSYIE